MPISLHFTTQHHPFEMLAIDDCSGGETDCAVVGYANDAMVGGQWRPVASQFLKIGSKDGADMKLGELVPGGTWAPANDFIKVLDEHTAVKFQATYFTWATVPPKQKTALGKKGIDETNFVNGWYKQIGGAADWDQNMNNEDVLAGQGFLAASTGDATAITLPAAL